jgi:hypothetical protein
MTSRREFWLGIGDDNTKRRTADVDRGDQCYADDARPSEAHRPSLAEPDVGERGGGIATAFGPETKREAD